MTREEKKSAYIAQLKESHAKHSSRMQETPSEEQYEQWADSWLHRDDMAAAKDTSVIPIGHYCYGTSPCGTKGTCPYWSNPKIPAEDQWKSPGTNPKMSESLYMDRTKWFAHCSFLERDSDYNAEDNTPGNMTLIWDKVKECDQNPEPPDTEDESAAFHEMADLVHDFMETHGLPHVNVGMVDREGERKLCVTRDFHKRQPEKNLLPELADALDALLSERPDLGRRLKDNYGSVSFSNKLDIEDQDLKES